MNKPKAVVLLSGGLDSATVLAMAQAEGYECYALSFDYGQRHRAELNAAVNIAQSLQIKNHKIFNLDIGQFGGSALTDTNLAVPEKMEAGIPITYVPARNTVFLSIALAWAETLGANHIFIGVNAVDYSGYPDCRPVFIEAFAQMANFATKAAVEGNLLKIHTPLLHLSKAEIINTGILLGIDYTKTVSCYKANAQGWACGKCDSCKLRKQGFIDAKQSDKTNYYDF